MIMPMKRVTGDSAVPGLHYSSLLVNFVFTDLISKLFPTNFSQATSLDKILVFKEELPFLTGLDPSQRSKHQFISFSSPEDP